MEEYQDISLGTFLHVLKDTKIRLREASGKFLTLAIYPTDDPALREVFYTYEKYVVKQISICADENHDSYLEIQIAEE